MLKRIFISGLAAIIPLAITVYIVIYLFYFADSILGRQLNKFLSHYVGFTIPGLGLLILLIVIFLLGFLIQLSRIKIFKWFGHSFQQLVLRIPLVNKIYFPVKQVVDFMFYSPQRAFQRVVLLEYPRHGIYTIGFITNYSTPSFMEKKHQKSVVVFIPSTPSPLTGFTVIMEEKDLTLLDIPIDDAIKIIVSGGLIGA